MPKLKLLPENATMRDAYNAYPETCAPLGLLTERIMRGPSPFSQAQRELIAAYVSGLNACRYCYGVHSAVAAACGVDNEILPVLLDDPSKAPIEESMKPVLAYARKLTLTPARVTGKDAEAIYAAGWDDDALYFTVAVTALFNFYNRFTDGLGLNAPPGYYDQAGARLSSEGYDLLDADPGKAPGSNRRPA